MPFAPNTVRGYIQAFDFSTLFNYLGWDNYRGSLTIPLEDRSVTLEGIAEKRGMVVYRCNDTLERKDRGKIERHVAKSAFEHVIIYTDGKTQQVWQWVRRETGKPLAQREERFHKGETGERLVQKLQGIAFSFEEEENLTLADVTSRVRATFDVERVTRRFYDQFKTEHDAFLAFTSGIPDGGLQRWYASVMLNRLMFVYFIQSKRFLDDKPNYLQYHLDRSVGNFYRDFLCPLFFDGFARKERTPEIQALFGNIPYLNGGLFLKHQIEELHGETIQIPDDAFRRLFAFFARYNWHLDDRPLRADNEINPDVLGYIFEKYINQKQMGAYYSKEDITEYIGQNTVIPFLFDEARKDCRVAFEGDNPVWRLTQDDPDRYIYPAVHHGVDLDLPVEIAAGLTDVSKRDRWNTSAPTEYALSTELWREVVARRQRCAEVRDKLKRGEMTTINDFITYNLNIRQFAQDVIDGAESSDLLRAFWKAINGVTVLDPTCGSGAFLFAALNILEPLYEACLDRMESFLKEPERGKKYRDFEEVIQRMETHPNRRYFVFKSIIVNNLYGVDIMEEAVEICKLRLFLKLVSQADEGKPIEALPDIDFNIRSGNTLVGFATLDEVKRAITRTTTGQMRMLMPDEQAATDRITEKAEDVDRLFKLFRAQQTALGGNITPEDKANLRTRLRALDDELNRYLAIRYNADIGGKDEYDKWLMSHQPFHWFVEFYGTLNAGGFDVTIGNPPWVEYPKVKADYTVKNITTLPCNNLWAFVTERSIGLTKKGGRLGLIVPMSLVCTERMKEVQDLLKATGTCWLSNYESDSNPGQLFDGVKQNVTIALQLVDGNRIQYGTRQYRFFSEARSFVFPVLQYVDLPRSYLSFGLPKVSSRIETSILEKLFRHSPLSSQLSRTSYSAIYVHRIAHYYIKCFNFVPFFKSDRDGVKKSEDYKEYQFYKPVEPLVAAVNSSIFYFYWQVFYDSFKAGKQCVESFPCNLIEATPVRNKLIELCNKLMVDMKNNSIRLKANYAATGAVEYDQFYPRTSKQIIDEIDRILAQHYNFTDEELDFIINYDIKYRIGRDGLDDFEDEE